MKTCRDCPFCEIVAGRGAASFVHGDDRVLAFMTLRPTRSGECLVIPRDHIDHFTDIPDDLASHLLVVAQRIARRMRDELWPLRVGMVVHGFGVAHANLILVPQYDPTDIVSGRHAYIEDGSIAFGLRHIQAVPRSELDAMAKRLQVRDTPEKSGRAGRA